MGPACYTKLIHFCGQSRRGYIMDEWSCRSINLLFESADGRRRKPVLFNGTQVSPHNSVEHYEQFCGLIDLLAELSGDTDAAELASRLSSVAGDARRNRGVWRQYVIEHMHRAPVGRRIAAVAR
jgi:hypothetical protein